MTDLLSENTANRIKGKIMSGEYPLGSKLPTEQELIDELKVSRSTVREAIKLLKSNHVVNIKRGIGTYVEMMPGLTNDPLGMSFLPIEQRAHDLLEMRLLLEPNVARLACERADSKDIEKLTACAVDTVEKFSRMKKSSNKKIAWDAAEADIEFHSVLYASTHNEALKRMFPLIRESLVHSYSIDAYLLAQRLSSHGGNPHVQIAQAIRDKNKDLAASLCFNHVNTSLSYIDKK